MTVINSISVLILYIITSGFIVFILSRIIQNHRSKQCYVYLIDSGGDIIKRQKYRAGLITRHKPKVSKSILVVDVGDNKVKEFVFKNIETKGSCIKDIGQLPENFVIFQIKDSKNYYIKYCTDISSTMIGFNNTLVFPPKKTAIGIYGNLCYGYSHSFTAMLTNGTYRLKDINLMCYGFSEKKK